MEDYESHPKVRSLEDAFSSAQINDADDSNNNKLVVAIDFGTTYSGVAYAFTAQPSEIFSVQDWPRTGGRSYEKCPTVLAYGTDGSIEWGFGIDERPGRIEAIKLLLDPDQDRPTYVPATEASEELEKLSKPAVDVAADYLRHLYDYAMSAIAAKYPKGFVDLIKKQNVLTVPAVWSDKAQDLTLQAARKAGIIGATLVKEPEAAALFTLHHMNDKGISPGDAIVVCDAGGGTVDLITYEVMSLKPFQLKELVSANGGICGSKMINERFHEYVKRVVGDEAFFKLRQLQAFRDGMKIFNDTIKPGFCKEEVVSRSLSFPRANLKDRPAKGLVRDALEIKWETLRDVFKPVVADIEKLVTAQITDSRLKRARENHPKADEIKAIFLVGGFGASAYVKSRIEEMHTDTTVIQPNDAWSAIVRGAVLFALPREASVITNVAPKHYGMDAMSFDIDPVQDAGRPRIWDEFMGKDAVMTMWWYIYKGDDLVRARPIEFDFYTDFTVNPASSPAQLRDRKFVLHESAQPAAPRHPGGSLKMNCTLRPDLSSVPVHLFEHMSRVEHGRTIERWRLNYKILVTIQSGPMMFSISCNGKQYGSVNADY